MKNLYQKIEYALFDQEYKSWQVFFIYLFIAFLVFSPSFLNLNYFWDDERFVFLNPEVLQAPSFLSFWNTQSAFFKSWPLGYGIFWTLINYSPFDSFTFFKSLNIFFHSINALLIYIILKSQKRKIGFIIPLIFLMHPMQVETVSWIFQLLTILALTFFLLSTYFFIKFLTAEKYLFSVLAFVFFVFSIWTKSIAILAPFFFLILALIYGLKLRHFLVIILFFGFSIFSGFVNIKGTRHVTNQPIGITNSFELMFDTMNAKIPSPFTPEKQSITENSEKLLFDFIFKKNKNKSTIKFDPQEIFLQAPAHYFLKTFLPINLQFIYKLENYGGIVSVVASLFFLVFPLGIFFLCKKKRWLLLSAVSLVFFLPYIGITNIAFFYWSNVSDRYMYGQIIFLVLLITFLIDSPKLIIRKIVITYIFLLLLLTIQYGLKFNNPLSLYTEIIKYK